jgi:hypothetical protein
MQEVTHNHRLIAVWRTQAARADTGQETVPCARERLWPNEGGRVLLHTLYTLRRTCAGDAAAAMVPVEASFR